MAPEGTLGRWSLWATHPGRLGAIAELYATKVAAAARAGDLRQDGYDVVVTLLRSFRLRQGFGGPALPSEAPIGA